MRRMLLEDCPPERASGLAGLMVTKCHRDQAHQVRIAPFLCTYIDARVHAYIRTCLPWFVTGPVAYNSDSSQQQQESTAPKRTPTFKYTHANTHVRAAWCALARRRLVN
jgi:hypothetical protein